MMAMSIANLGIKKQVAEMRKTIMMNKPSSRVVIALRLQEIALRLQEIALKRLENRAIAWADSDKPDVRLVGEELAFLRAFRAMLRTIPVPKKAKKKR